MPRSCCCPNFAVQQQLLWMARFCACQSSSYPTAQPSHPNQATLPPPQPPLAALPCRRYVWASKAAPGKNGPGDVLAVGPGDINSTTEFLQVSSFVRSLSCCLVATAAAGPSQQHAKALKPDLSSLSEGVPKVADWRLPWQAMCGDNCARPPPATRILRKLQPLHCSLIFAETCCRWRPGTPQTSASTTSRGRLPVRAPRALLPVLLQVEPSQQGYTHRRMFKAARTGACSGLRVQLPLRGHALCPLHAPTVRCTRLPAGRPARRRPEWLCLDVDGLF